MRTKRERLSVLMMVGMTLVAGRAGAEPVAEPVAAPSAAAPAPRPAPPAASVSVPRVKEGFMAIPSIGINSFQGDSGRGAGVGLRVGLLAGSRLTQLFSLNLGVAFDKINLNASGASDIAFDLGLSPLFHFPLEKFEIVAGPIVGSFVDKFGAGSGMFAIDTWTYGWSVGANAGVFVPVGSKASVGGMFNFLLRNPFKSCVSMNGTDNCITDNLQSAKVLALTAAAMF